MTRADAVLFDMDGLLVDSEPLWTVAEIELAESLGGSWDDTIKAAIVGTRLDAAVPKILAWYDVDHGPAEVANAMDFLLRRMVELFHDRLPLMPGALELVDAVRALGVRTALVSSSYRVLVDAALDSLDPNRFDVTLAGDEVGHGKPSPEPYLTACSLLGVEPSRCVVLEDAMSGVQSGEAAGATVVAVPWVARIAATSRRPVVDSLAVIDPVWLVSQTLQQSEAALVEVPVTRRDDDVVDVWHGESVPDPYRWLEDTESEETAAWVREQNAATTAHLEGLPDRQAIREQLAQVWDVTRYAAPFHHGGKWFFTRHDPGANQPVLRVSDDPSDDGRVLLDPNLLSADGTVALMVWAVSSDGSRLVYATSSAGSDWMTWRVRDVVTATDLDDLVEWSKFCEASWLPDGSGFFYDALDAPLKGQEFLATNDGRRLQLHRIGTPQSEDELIYVDPDPKWEPEGKTSADGRWLVVSIDRGTNPESIIRVLDLQDRAGELRDLIPVPDFDSRVIGNDGSTFFVLTDRDAPRKRVVAIDLDQPEPEHWREVIPEGVDALIDVHQAGGRLVAHVLHDASSKLQIWTAGGEYIGEAALPQHVTITEVSADNDLPTLHIGVTSFTDPASVWACDVSTGATRQVRESALPSDLTSIVVTRALAPSSDGTEVPMFLLHRRDVEPTGDVRTMLYGYGGFDIPITPTFNAGWLVWLRRGGLLAIANLRGGGEFGKEWYDAGRLAHKQNVFNDFAGCARWLASSGWTRADGIAINGGSNGGLLVGAVLTQHPELIGAAVPEVGVLDMLRYARFTIGWAWSGDLGVPEDPEQFAWLRAYSPLHAIKPGTAYPATLIMTGDHDDRVVPGHSFKFAATLQRAQRGSAPVLIRVETAGGHGAGTPVSKLIEARADMIAFCEAAL